MSNRKLLIEHSTIYIIPAYIWTTLQHTLRAPLNHLDTISNPLGTHYGSTIRTKAARNKFAQHFYIWPAAGIKPKTFCSRVQHLIHLATYSHNMSFQSQWNSLILWKGLWGTGGRRLVFGGFKYGLNPMPSRPGLPGIAVEVQQQQQQQQQ